MLHLLLESTFDLKGFNSICISTGGERGSVTFMKMPINIELRKMFF